LHNIEFLDYVLQKDLIDEDRYLQITDSSDYLKAFLWILRQKKDSYDEAIVVVLQQ
jgi:hypothetical protein